ncbi:MAG TPA: hypothetical protein PLP31_04720 [Thermoanaerobaculaceae bacterium]|nr:hypothetical protein [Thermoanaerobaculaceae bacterium]
MKRAHLPAVDTRVVGSSLVTERRPRGVSHDRAPGLAATAVTVGPELPSADGTASPTGTRAALADVLRFAGAQATDTSDRTAD